MLDIDQEHPDYVAQKAMWKRYRDLYTGGEQFRVNAQDYLVRRQREPGDVYAERLNRVFYENYVGSIVDWYAATLFRIAPVVTFEGNNEGSRAFFADFVDDVDRRGTNLAEFFRRLFIETVITGSSYTLVDFPRASAKFGTRGEEDAAGASRAYLVDYAADDVINWSLDEQGNFEWVVIRATCLKNDRLGDANWRTEKRWSYYDRESFRIYASADETGPGSTPKLIDEGTHGLAKLGVVPLFTLRVPQGLWILNRAGSLQLEHFNKSNALAWALTMGLFAMPVVYSDRDWSQMVGESYYIQLGTGDRFGWTEPEGKVYQIAADNLTQLQEEIYRVCYFPQAGGALDKGARMSGLSKQMDFAITQEVLGAYGDAMKDLARRVLRAISAARADEFQIGVTGMDEFDISDFSSELEQAGKLLALGVNSPTLKKEVFKKLALKYLSDTRQDIKDRVAAEIEGVQA